MADNILLCISPPTLYFFIFTFSPKTIMYYIYLYNSLDLKIQEMCHLATLKKK